MPLYRKDPNNNKKQIPNELDDNAYDRVVVPGQYVHVKSPNYVIINKVLTEPVGFFFGTSGSLSTLGKSDVDNYPILGDDTAAGTRLDIHPNAWSGSSADAGNISFVYKGGLSSGGR